MLSAFALTNCTQEIDNPAQQPEETGYPFEIVASTVDTKTVNDGMSTKWAANDQINLFHAVTGDADYQSNGAFTVKDVEVGSFTGNLSETLDVEEEYDWYALYPYSDKITTPGAKTTGYTYIGYSSGLNQTGYNSTASLKGSVCPLYGVAKAVPGSDMPTIMMNHLSSVVAINVTNDTDEPLTITTASLTAPVDIVGSYFIDITATPVTYTKRGDSYVKKTATVNVSKGTALSNGESAVLYLAIKPFTATKGQQLALSVNGYEKKITLENDVTFSAGKIKTVNFSYNNTAKTENITLPWYEDFSSEDLTSYVTASASLYKENLAGGTSPELFLAKGAGSLTAAFDLEGYTGTLTLVYLTNNDSRISVSSTTEGVTVKKDETSEYLITVPEAGVEVLTLVIKNTDSSNNVRIDDIRLVKGLIQNQSLSFETSAYTFELDSDEANAFEGQPVLGANTKVTYTSSNPDVAAVDANTGKITWGTEAGNTVITAVAEADNMYKSAYATYEITLTKPLSGDLTIGESWAYTFTKSMWSANGDKVLKDLTWTLSGDGGYWGWDSKGKGQQFGSKGKPYTNMKLSTSEYVGGIKTIKISTSGASGTGAKLKVEVNGKQYGSSIPLTSSNMEYTFEVEDADMQAGEIVFTYTQSTAKAIYIKAISIN